MNNEVKNVPELRFPEFSGEWKEKELGQCTNLITKGTTPKDKSGKGTINYIKVENIYNAKIKPRMKININEHEGYLKRSKLEANDILFSIAGTLGRTAVVNKSHLPANTNQALAIIRGYDFETNFLITTLGGHAVAKYIRKNPTVGAQPNLSLNQVSKLIINTPSKNEQKKIGIFFSKLDKQIELEEQKLSLLEEQKKGYMQKIFSQELRFKGNNGEEYPKWESKKLEEVAIINTGKSKIVNEESGAYSNLGSTGVLGKSSHYEYDGNFILTARVGHYAGKLYNFSGKANISDNTIFLETDLNLNFTLNMLNNYNLKRIAFGSGQPLIKSSELKKLIFNIPCGEEEQKIGGFLSGFDSLIGKQSHKIELLKERKKGFLQKMFV
ncbi:MULTISPECIES: restriction endonuclease subunit S [unclassified Staphylococcus]|uniref:restriction endonuclease subunit S n=1 Tax=unclassified Staphylococcus TaxID=91994 RepID=UPI001AEC625F|nr:MULTISPECIES: restriction endonuclease subunit S [unclassified Staphylococcus]